MKDILFAWLIKPRYQLNFIESLVGVIGLCILIILSVRIYCLVMTIIDKIKERKKKSESNRFIK